MLAACDHIPGGGLLPILAVASAGLVAGCGPEDEPAMRDRLGQYFSLRDTVAYEARRPCVAGVFRLADDQVKAAMPVANGVGEMLALLAREDLALLKDRGHSPDAAFVTVMNVERARGMQMRRAGLEARACMDATIETAFRHALDGVGNMVAYDVKSGLLMLVDRRNRLLVVARGAQA
ncbi:hypothetical protein FDP25_02395 [Roseovarius sp. A21]|uniref:Uncharacterized protein n=1 Tax=Roseovarius bejariae TaxID=2576383 RepID=A0A844CG73_9RHOB|nr:hypothetical protein [Roseovarius bejariae]MRU14271.1 hypothetical protein [Roseovarius bejariae]